MDAVFLQQFAHERFRVFTRLFQFWKERFFLNPEVQRYPMLEGFEEGFLLVYSSVCVCGVFLEKVYEGFFEKVNFREHFPVFSVQYVPCAHSCCLNQQFLFC